MRTGYGLSFVAACIERERLLNRCQCAMQCIDYDKTVRNELVVVPLVKTRTPWNLDQGECCIRLLISVDIIPLIVAHGSTDLVSNEVSTKGCWYILLQCRSLNHTLCIFTHAMAHKGWCTAYLHFLIPRQRGRASRQIWSTENLNKGRGSTGDLDDRSLGNTTIFR